MQAMRKEQLSRPPRWATIRDSRSGLPMLACPPVIDPRPTMDALARSRAATMLLFTALAWGAMFSIAKGALHAIDAFHLTALRYVPASLVMLAVLAAVEGIHALRPSPG